MGLGRRGFGSLHDQISLLNREQERLDLGCGVVALDLERTTRVRLFLWLAIQDTILNNKNRVRHHIAADASCDLCHTSEESTTHVLRDCAFATDSWRKLGAFDVSGSQLQGDTAIWMKHYLRDGNKSLMFGVHCWMLWRNRNDRIFSGTSQTPDNVVQR
ncbi:Putative ribonuclease H protein At1g65750 [Linum perenne]